MTEPSGDRAPEELAWRRYRQMQILLDRAIARDLRRGSGLSDADYDVLTALSGATDGPRRAGDLAVELTWSSSRLAHHVGRMEGRGLVRRTAVDGDARGATISLTAAGRRTLRSAAPKHQASVRAHLLDLLSPAEVRSLDRIAAKVVAHLEGAE